MIERAQRNSVKVILANDYADYPSALGTCNLKLLSERRESKVLQFRAIKHPEHRKNFPLSEKYTNNLHNKRVTEKY